MKTEGKQPKMNGSLGRKIVTAGNDNGKENSKLKRVHREHTDYWEPDSYENSYDLEDCDPSTHNCENQGPPRRKTPAKTWTMVFSHDTSGGLFTDEDVKSKNPSEPYGQLFSILDSLQTMRSNDGTFHLKLCYPELSCHPFPHSQPCNEWKQTSNPVTENTIQGFKPIRLCFRVNYGTGGKFVGLGKEEKRSETLISSSPGDNNWWFAVGALKYHWRKHFIPGPPPRNVKKVQLFVKN